MAWQLLHSESPVMYRLLEDSGEPTKKQAPARASATKSGPEQKGRPVGEPAIGTVEKSTGHDLLGGQ
jgi:hypothetical protein